MLSFFSEFTVALDLGTRNILVSDPQKVLYRQQNIAACLESESSPKKKLIVGNKAQEIFERNPSQYKIIKPLQKGVICDFKNCSDIAESALKAASPLSFRKPHLLVTVPLDVTPIEREAFEEAFTSKGYKKVQLLPEPVADAVGLVRDFVRKKGVLIVDVGAGITECVLFSYGGLVCNTSLRLGGEDFESEVISFFKKKYNFEIGTLTALHLLDLLGQQRPESYLETQEVKGIDLYRRTPSTLRFELAEINDCLDSLFMRVVRSLLSLLEKTPEELSSEVMENGIYLTGGASQFKKLVELMEKHSGLKVIPDAQPLLGVARGEIALLQNRKLFDQLANQYF